MTEKKKILLLSTGDINGAYEAMYRISLYLHETNKYEIGLVVRHKTRSDSFVYQAKGAAVPVYKKIAGRLASYFSSNKIKFDPKYEFLEDDERARYTDASDILQAIPFKPDIVIAGMTDGYANTATLAEIHKATGAKIFTLTVDMSVFTGGCHFAWDCKGYQSDCSDCPAVSGTEDKKWVQENFSIKKKNAALAGIRVIAGSGWTVNQARASAIFKNQEEIYNTNSLIDLGLFNNKHRSYAKHIFDVPEGAKLIFSGAQSVHNPRKGFTYFVDALQQLWEQMDEELRSNVYVLIAGRTTDPKAFADIPFKKHIIDYIKDYRLLSLAYQASDVFVCSSIEDSGPMTVSEALACGTPVVGFDMGIVHNMVKTGENGYKAVLKDSKDLTAGMHRILTLPEAQFLTYSENAIDQVRRHSSRETLLNVIEAISNGQ